MSVVYTILSTRFPAIFLLAAFLSISVFIQGQDGKECQGTLITLDATFDKAVEISSLAWAGDSLYMVSAKCGLAFSSKITGQNICYSVQTMEAKDYEGMAYWNNHFYLSDDSRPAVYVFNKAFQKIKRIPINLRKGDEGPGINNKGFEGLAVLNATTFYILLEKISGKDSAVLYKATLNNKGQLDIQYKKYLPLGKNSRYCDLYYRDQVLYLLKSTFDSAIACTDVRNKYEIMTLNLTSTLDVESHDRLIEPVPYLSLSTCVRKHCNQSNSNVEGITMDNAGNFYFVSDNHFGSKACEKSGERTLLMRIKK